MSKASAARICATALVTTALLLMVAANANAQNPGNPTILEHVENVEAAVNTLASQQQTLQTTVDTLGTVLQTLQTTTNTVMSSLATLTTRLTNITSQLTDVTNRLAPPASVTTTALLKIEGFVANCFAQNVGTQSVGVRITMFTFEGQIAAQNEEVLPAGHAGGVQLTFPNSAYWCAFDMTAGSSADIRAALTIDDRITAQPLVIAEAR